jgi:chemotaxis protein MotA
MLASLGSFIVIFSVLGGYAAMGGHLYTLWQPFELMIVLGAAIGAYVVGNPAHILKNTWSSISGLSKPPRYNRDSYIELLSMLFIVFRTARLKGWKSLEHHIEKPESSDIFRKFPSFYQNPHAVIFFCDYIRIVSLGSGNPYEIATLMDEEIETIHGERVQLSDALQVMADATPALGIVAAVLGVIRAMGSINEPPAVLGHMIAGALCGTFFGVWLSYGFIGPVAANLRSRIDAEMKYYLCMKAGILAYLQGSAPQIAIEFARKVLLQEDRPTFLEVEDATMAFPVKIEMPPGLAAAKTS